MAASEALLLVPGLLCSPALFAPQVAAFARDRHVQVADHTRVDRIDAIARDILVTAPPTFALAGLSMGGYIALAIHRLAPDRVTRLALLDTSARPDPAERAADRRRLVEIARTEGVRKVQSMLMPRLILPSRLSDSALVETALQMADDTGFDAFMRQQEAIIARIDARPALGAIRCPALVLAGEQDLQTPPDIAREIAAGIPGSSLVIVPDCGHLSTLERPDAVNRALEQWLAS